MGSRESGVGCFPADIEYSVREFTRLLLKAMRLSGSKAFEEALSSAISSAAELDTITRGHYGVGLPVKVYEKLRECMRAKLCGEGDVKELVTIVKRFLERQCSLA